MSSVLHLTPRHVCIYDFIVKFKQTNDGIAPSVLEICEATGISSTSMVRHYFTTLVLLGMIKVDYSGKKSRMISIPGARWLPPSLSVTNSSPLSRADRVKLISASSIPE